MTDEQAVELLGLLAVYYSSTEFDPLDPSKVTVSELAGDLIDSLPRDLVPSEVGCLKPDALTWPGGSSIARAIERAHRRGRRGH